VFGVQDEGGVHRPNPGCGRRPPVQDVQEVAADGVVVGLYEDVLTVVAVVIPVRQHGAEGGNQPIGDVTRAGNTMVVLLR